MNLPNYDKEPNIKRAVEGARKMLEVGDEQFATDAVHNIARLCLSDLNTALYVLAKTTLYAAKLEKTILEMEAVGEESNNQN